MEGTKLEMAAGIAVAGFVKFSRAKTAPNHEFYMPTSIAIVLLTSSFLKLIFAIK